jgi:HlyD family secretion protein
MKNIKKIALILGGLLVLAIILGKVFGGKKDAAEVEVQTCVRRNLVESVSASGKIQPQKEVSIQSEVSGLITQLLVKEGDQVIQGQLLVVINPDVYQSALSRAEAGLNSAKSNLSSARARLLQAEAQFKVNDLNYKRQQKLHKDGVIAQAEFENATSQWETSSAEVTAAKESINSAEFAVESAKASVTESSDNLKRTTIAAPMSGTVTALTKEIGENVLGNNMMSGDVIMKISALNHMEVNVEVNEADIMHVQLGDTAWVEVDAYRDQKFKGIVTEIGNTALNAMGNAALTMDQVTNFSIKVLILPESYSHMVENEKVGSSPFRTGMSATVEIQTASVMQALSIPIKAIASREDTASTSILERYKEEKKSVEAEKKELYTVVFVMNETTQQADLRIVKTGIQDDEFIEVLSGVLEQEKVITGPYDLVSRDLLNHAPVRLMKDSEPKKGSE